MPDQTKVNENGNEDTSVIQNLSEFASDVISLCELQAKLFAVDGQAALQKVFAPLCILFMGIAVLTGCIPVTLAAIALLITDNSVLTLGQSLLIVVATGFVIGAGVVYSAWSSLSRETSLFSRSLRECDANSRWVKGVFSRLGRIPSPQDSLH